MKKLCLFLVLAFALPLVCGAAGKPVGLWYGPGAPRLSELMRGTLFTPQWCAEKPVYKEFKGENFEQYSAVVYMQGDSPLRFRPMTKEKIAALEKFVRKGGTLLILVDRAATGNAVPGEMATLLGGKKWVKFSGSAEVADPAWKDCTAIPQVQKCMLHGPVLALAGLTTAKPVFSAGKGAAMGSVNSLGKGKVWFFNLSFTHSLPPYRQPYSRTANAALDQLWPFVKHFHAILMETKPQLDPTPREQWEPVPCGPKVSKIEWKKPVERIPAPARKFTKHEGEEFFLVKDGAPCAVIANPLPSQRGAAKKLIRIVREMTGAELSIGRAKAGQGVIRFVKTDALKIVVSPKEIRLEGGSEQALHTFLREFAGYRMLWPGKDGEVIPKRTTFSVPGCELIDAPALKMRTMRNGLSCGLKVWKTPEGEEVKIAYPERIVAMCNKIGMDPRVLKEKQSGHGAWWQANRLGGGMNTVGGGNFYSWPKKYGKTHPEYFALQFNGIRKVGDHNVRICKSNPEVIATAAKEMADRMTKDKKAEYAKFSPSDGGYDLFCMCPKCRAWDPADGPRHTSRVFLGRNRPVFQYVGMTDRVLRFTAEAGKELQKTHPDAKIFFLAYSSYLKPPCYFRDVPKNLVVTFVGLDYLNDEYLRKTREYWDIWAGMAQEMVLRPNLIGGGNAMPLCYVHEMDKDIKHCYKTGMVGADFDTVPHHWATMGLNYYVLAQLLWNPLTPVDEIIDDYCQNGFGPGAGAVKEYFALCEKLTKQLAAQKAQDIRKLEDLTETVESGSGLRNYLKVFTPEKLAEMAKLLAKAHAACVKNSPEQHRVEFLQAGLRFTTLRLDFARKYHATKGNTKKLGPEVDALRAEYQKIFDAYPFAVNYPGVASHDYYSFWRNCGRK